MKKLLLTLGTVAAIAAPVASVVACDKTPAKVTPTKTGGTTGSNPTTPAKPTPTPAQLAATKLADDKAAAIVKLKTIAHQVVTQTVFTTAINKAKDEKELAAVLGIMNKLAGHIYTNKDLSQADTTGLAFKNLNSKLGIMYTGYPPTNIHYHKDLEVLEFTIPDGTLLYYSIIKR